MFKCRSGNVMPYINYEEINRYKPDYAELMSNPFYTMLDNTDMYIMASPAD